MADDGGAAIDALRKKAEQDLADTKKMWADKLMAEQKKAAAELETTKRKMMKQTEDMKTELDAKYRALEDATAQSSAQATADSSEQLNAKIGALGAEKAKVIQESDAKIAALQTDLNDLKAKAKADLEKSKSAHADAKSAAGGAGDLLAEFAKTINASAKDGVPLLQAARDALAAKDAQIDEIELAHDRMVDEIEIYKKFWEGKDEVQVACEEALQVSKELREQVAETSSERTKLESQVDNLKADADRMRQEVIVLGEEKGLVQSSVEGLNSDNAEMRAQSANAVAESAEKIAALETETAKLKELSAVATAEASQKMTELRTTLTDKSSAVSSELAEAKAEVTKLGTDAETAVATFSATLQKKDQEIGDLSIVRKELESTINLKNKDMETYAGKLAESGSELASTKTELNSATQELNMTTARGQADADKAAASAAELTNSVNVAKLENESLQKTIKRREREAATAQKTAEALRSTLNDKSQAFTDLKIELEHVSSERDGLAKQVQTVMSEMSSKINVTTDDFQKERAILVAAHGEQVSSLENTIKLNEKDNQARMADLSAARAAADAKTLAALKQLAEFQGRFETISNSLNSEKAMADVMRNEVSRALQERNQVITDLAARNATYVQMQEASDKMTAQWKADLETKAAERTAMTEAQAKLSEEIAAQAATIDGVRAEAAASVAATTAAAAGQKAAEDAQAIADAQIVALNEQMVNAEQVRAALAAEHQKDLAENTAKRQELTEKVQALYAETSAAMTTTEEAKKSLQESQQANSELKVKIDAREKDVQRATELEAQLRAQLATAADAVAATTVETTAAATTAAGEMTAANAKMKELEDKIATAATAAEAQMLTIATCNAQVAEAEAKTSDAVATAASETARFEGLASDAKNAAAAQLQAEKDLMAANGKAEGEKSELHVQITAIQAELNSVTDAKDKAESELTDMTNMERTYEKEKNVLEKELKSLTEDREGLEVRFATLSAKLIEIDSEMEQIMKTESSERTQLEQNLAKKQAELTTAAETNSASEAAKMALEGAKADLEGQVETASSQLEEAKRAQAEATASLSASSASLADAKAAAEEARKKATADLEAANAGKAGAVAAQEKTAGELATATAGQTAAKASASEAATAMGLAEAAKAVADSKVEGAAAAELSLQTAFGETKASLQKMVDDSNAQASAAAGQQLAAEQKLGEAMAALEAAQALAAINVEKRKASDDQLAAQSAQLQSNTSQVSGLSTQLQEMSAKASRADGNVTEVSTELASLQDEISQLQKQVQQAESREEAAVDKSKRMETKLHSLEQAHLNSSELVSELLQAYAQSNKSRLKQQTDMAKLLDLFRNTQAALKASGRPAKGGEIVPQEVRENALALQAAIEGAKSAFDGTAISVEAEVVANIQKHMGDKGGGVTLSADTQRMVETGMVDPMSAMSASSSLYAFKEGMLAKMGGGKSGRGKNYKDRYFRLGKNTLSYSASNSSSAKVLGIVQLTGATVQVGKDSKFTIKCVDRNFDLKAKSSAERDGWISAIKKNIAVAGEGSDDDE